MSQETVTDRALAVRPKATTPTDPARRMRRGAALGRWKSASLQLTAATLQAFSAAAGPRTLVFYLRSAEPARFPASQWPCHNDAADLIRHTVNQG